MMAEAKPTTGARPMAPKPMSPHLSIFRPYVNMVLSIMHRITGVVNYWGSLLLTAWLISAAMGEPQFNAVSSFMGSPIGLIILVGFTWSVMHHMLGGIRHFIWDTGHGFSLPVVRALSWATLFGSVTLTGLIWFVGLSLWGNS
jgi:succinate dehydrogenase / fumarate reductase, cytochrome b subunit